MKDKVKYRQCQLQNGNRHMASWLPEQYAKIDKVLEIKQNEVWENGWIVKTVGDEIIEDPPTVEQMIRKHRQRTGDSLPKK